MKKSRLRMNLYELCDWKAIEHHLARQAAKGWRLRRAEGSFWRYERAEPACVQYEVTYLPSVGETTPRPDPNLQELDTICAAAGWRHVAEWNGMQIYENEAANPAPIETDERLRLQAIHATMLRRYIAPLALVCLLELMLLGIMVIPLQIAQTTMPVLNTCFILCLLYAPLAFAEYFAWYGIASLAVRLDRPCPSNRALTILGQGITLVAFALLISTFFLYNASSPISGAFRTVRWGIYLALYFLVGWGVSRLRIYLRERGFSSVANSAISFGLGFVLYFILILWWQSALW